MVSATRNGRNERYIPLLVLLLVLIVCSIRGYATVAGLVRPADWDSFRDIGYIQALLDGNWLGDPLFGGEIRYYPPLMHAIAAAAVWIGNRRPQTLAVAGSVLATGEADDDGTHPEIPGNEYSREHG